MKVRSIFDKIALLTTILFGIAGSSISLNRYWQYQSFYYDFGIFDSAIWKMSRFQPPVIDHLIMSGKWIFADHFNPAIFLLSPLYWITQHPEIMFIAQAVMVALSGWIIYQIGIIVIKNKLASLTVLITYFLYIGLQNAVISDFHEVTIMTLPLSLVFLAIAKKNKWLYWLTFIITIGFKETLFSLGIGLAIFIFFTNRQWRWIAYMTFLISLLYGYLTIKVIIPFFAHQSYYYTITQTVHIVDSLKLLIYPFEKIQTVFLSFYSFLLLPLLYPPTWIMLAVNFGSRFMSVGNRSGLGMHYSAEIAPTLAIATIYGLGFLKSKMSVKFLHIVSALLIINAFILYRFILRGPFALAYHPVFYKHTKEFGFLNKLISKVPGCGTVAAQNNLASHLTHRPFVWMLRDDFENKADYIIMDLRAGQNPNNFLAIRDPKQLLNTAINKYKYQIYYKNNDQYILKKPGVRSSCAD